MADNFFDNGLIHMCIGEHWDRCMTAAVWGMVDVQGLQQWFKYIDVIIMVSKMLTVHGVDKVFTVRTVIVPGGVKGQDFFGDRDFADTIFCFAVNYVEVSFRQVDIFFYITAQK